MHLVWKITNLKIEKTFLVERCSEGWISGENGEVSQLLACVHACIANKNNATDSKFLLVIWLTVLCIGNNINFTYVTFFSEIADHKTQNFITERKTNHRFTQSINFNCKHDNNDAAGGCSWELSSAFCARNRPVRWPDPVWWLTAAGQLNSHDARRHQKQH